MTTLPPTITESTVFQKAVLDYCERTDQEPNELTDAKYLEIALSIRTLREVVEDGAKALGSRMATTTGVRRVSLVVYEERKATCKSNKCGRCIISKQGNIVCGQCGCSGSNMEAALWDPKESCRLPEVQKLWKATIDG